MDVFLLGILAFIVLLVLILGFVFAQPMFLMLGGMSLIILSAVFFVSGYDTTVNPVTSKESLTLNYDQNQNISSADYNYFHVNSKSSATVYGLGLAGLVTGIIIMLLGVLGIHARAEKDSNRGYSS